MELIKCEKLEKSMAELQFSVDAETYKKAVDAAFKREGKKYTVPGFRKGKAPKGMIEKMYGADVFTYDAINDLFPAAYEEAVKAADIEVVGRPEVEIVSESTADGVVLKVKVAVKPQMKLEGYKGLEVTKKVEPVTDEQVDQEIKRMQERNARQLTREGAAQDGDIVDIDFDGSVDGVHFDGGKAEHYSLTLGSGSFIPGFEEQIVGHSAGDEFDVNVKFPEEYHAEELAGKDAVFAIKLHEVKYKELPELDDEFAKDVSEYDTLDELKASIRKNMEERNAKMAEQEMENALVDLAIEKMEGEIPEAMYESKMDDLVQDFEYRLQQQGMSLKTYLQYMGQDLAAFRSNFMDAAQKQVKQRLAMEAIAEQEKFEIADEALEEEYNKIAEMYKMEADQVKKFIDADSLKKDMAVNKALDLLKETAKVVEG